MKFQSKSINNNTAVNYITQVLFVIYVAALVWILIFKLGVHFSYMQEGRINLIPFREALVLKGKIHVSELILNTVIFIPLGIYAAILFDKLQFVKSGFLCFVISLVIEGLQFIFKIGAFDITDIIANTIGGLIGLIIWKTIAKLLQDKVRAQKVINVLAGTGTIVIILFLILLKLKMLPIRYQ